MVDLFGGLGDLPEAVEHAHRQRKLDHGRAARCSRQRLHVGHDRAEVGIGEAVVVFARHHAQRPAVGLDAVAQAAHPVDRLVRGRHTAGGARDVGAGQVQAIARLDERAAAAVGAVAIGAAARAVEVAAAFECGGVCRHRHRLHLDVDVSLRSALGLLQADEDHGRHDDRQHEQCGQAAANPDTHGSLPEWRSTSGGRVWPSDGDAA
jgi:hypothetical protein